MNIGIFQDLHANLPALKKALEVFRDHQCSRIYHVGDLIGIGPYPKEVIDMALSIPEMEFIMGNHDHWYTYGLPQPIPDYMNGEEVAHHMDASADWGKASVYSPAVGMEEKPVFSPWKKGHFSALWTR